MNSTTVGKEERGNVKVSDVFFITGSALLIILLIKKIACMTICCFGIHKVKALKATIETNEEQIELLEVSVGQLRADVNNLLDKNDQPRGLTNELGKL